jgi:hypothetical protein
LSSVHFFRVRETPCPHPEQFNLSVFLIPLSLSCVDLVAIFCRVLSASLTIAIALFFCR